MGAQNYEGFKKCFGKDECEIEGMSLWLRVGYSGAVEKN